MWWDTVRSGGPALLTVSPGASRSRCGHRDGHQTLLWTWNSLTCNLKDNSGKPGYSRNRGPWGNSDLCGVKPDHEVDS